MEILKGKLKSPFRFLIYGQAGVGKTTFAAEAPDPLIIDCEKGSGMVNCDRIIPESYADFIKCCKMFKESNYKTLVVDTIDVLEIFISEKICSEYKVKKVEDLPYGQGYAAMCQEWNKLLNSFDSLGKNYIFIAHEKIKLVKDIETGSEYDKYIIKMHEKSAAYIVARMDAVLFCKYENIVNSNKGINSNTGRRVCVTQETGSCVAKNRYNLEIIEDMNKQLYTKIGV